MMKHISALLSLILLIAILAGCSSRNTSSSESDIPPASASEPAASAASTSEAPSEPPEASSQPEESSEVGTIETAAFALSYEGAPQEMTAGDTIGDWTLADLQITYDNEGSNNMLEALFAGNITLERERRKTRW